MCAATQGQPKSALTAEQILEKSIEAAGGRARLEKLTSSLAKANMEIEPQGVHSTLELYSKMPNKRLVVTNIEGYGEIKQGFDGTSGWTQDPMRGLVDQQGRELEDAKLEATFNAQLKWREMFAKIELVGKEKVNGREAYVLRLTRSDGKPITSLYDAQTFLLVRQTGVRDTAQGPLAFRADLSDYREVEGIKAPFLITQQTGGSTITIRVVELKNNVEIEDAKFAKPKPQQ